MGHRHAFVLFAFISLVVSLFASLPQPPFYIPKAYGFDGSGGEFGKWTWISPIMTIIANATANAGDTEAHAYGFQDIVNAITYYSWSALYNRSTSGKQFEFSFRIVIGDASTTTWFVDTEKQVTFTQASVTANYQKLIEVKAKAYLRFGILEDASDKLGSRGIVMYDLDTTYYYTWHIYSATEKSYIYGSYFRGGQQNRAHRLQLAANAPIYNTVLEQLDLYGGSVDAYDLTVRKAYISIEFTMGTFEKIQLYNNNPYALEIYGTYAFSVKNLYARNSNTKTIYAYAITTDKYLINPDFDSWTFQWSGTSTAKVFRQYDFDLTVATAANVPIENANVTLTYYGQGGGTKGTWLTDANGAIPQQTVTSGFYNQTGGNTIYDYNPYEITITKEGYQTYQRNFTELEKKSWNIALLPTSTPTEAEGMEVYLSLGGLLVFAVFFPFMLIGRRKWKEANGSS